MPRSPSIWKHRKWFSDKRELGEAIFRAKNIDEFEKRVQWLSEGSLMYHITQFTSPWIHGGIPEEKELYKEFMEYVLNNNTMGKTFKDIQKKGKHTFEGPKVKERKKFAPATKVEKPKKGKGSYERGNAFEEDEEENEEKACWKGYEKKGMKKKGKKKVPDCVKESTSITKFIEAILSENPAEAHKHLKNAVDLKLQKRILAEINNPLF